MPKLLRGSSLSREDKGSAEGAGTAADCTERAGESSLELLLESLEQKSNMDLDVIPSLSFIYIIMIKRWIFCATVNYSYSYFLP